MTKQSFYYEDDGYKKVKDYKPKYERIELNIFSDKKCLYLKIPYKKIIDFKKVVEEYGEHELLSVVDYDTTHTTSLIIKEQKDD